MSENNPASVTENQTKGPVKAVIDSSLVPTIRAWLKKRGGVRVWRDNLIGQPAPDTFTPVLDDEGKESDSRPHWRYGAAATLTREEDFSVQREEMVASLAVRVKNNGQIYAQDLQKILKIVSNLDEKAKSEGSADEHFWRFIGRYDRVGAFVARDAGLLSDFSEENEQTPVFPEGFDPNRAAG